jgi:CHAD domain-containing protein
VWAAGLRAELSWLADELGRVRDLDVLMANLRAVRPGVMSDDRGAPDRLLAELARQREAEGVRLLASLDDQRAAIMLDHLHAAVDGPVARPVTDDDAACVMFPLVRRPWRRLRRAVGGLGGQPNVDELHRVRILTKRARYAAEAVTPVFGADARRFARRAGALQEVLGDLNDAVVARRWLVETASRLDAPAAFAAGQLAQRMADRAEAGLGDWRRSYRRLQRRATWLDRRVAPDPRPDPRPAPPA